MSERPTLTERLSHKKYKLLASVLAGLALAGCGGANVEARAPAPSTVSAEATPGPTIIDGEVPEPAAEPGDVIEKDTRTPEQITEDVKQTSIALAENIVDLLAKSDQTQVDTSGIITTMPDYDVLSGPEFSVSYSEGGEAPPGVVGQAVFEASIPTETHGKVDRLLIALDVKNGNPLTDSNQAPLRPQLLQKALNDPKTLQLSILAPLAYTNAEVGSQQFGLAYNAAENHTVVINDTTGSGYAVDGPAAKEYEKLAHTLMNRIDPTYKIPE